MRNEKWSQAFEAMRGKALELEAVGIMAIAEKTANGEIDMQLQSCGKDFDGWGNFYSIACSKIMEMIRTGKPSGTLAPLAGEFENFVGGTLAKASNGMLVGDYYVTFSGAAGEIDLEIAQVGLDILLTD